MRSPISLKPEILDGGSTNHNQVFQITMQQYDAMQTAFIFYTVYCMSYPLHSMQNVHHAVLYSLAVLSKVNSKVKKNDFNFKFDLRGKQCQWLRQYEASLHAALLNLSTSQRDLTLCPAAFTILCVEKGNASLLRSVSNTSCKSSRLQTHKSHLHFTVSVCNRTT